MTLSQAISRADALCPNQYTNDQKTAWISSLDGTIFEEIIKTHEGHDEDTFDGYTYDASTAATVELLVPFPYDDIYIFWLISQYYLNNAEMENYNSEITLYNTAYADYADYYNRHNMPKQKATFFKT